MINLFKPITNLWGSLSRNVGSWFSSEEEEDNSAEKALEDLPEEISQQLVKVTKNLASPKAHQKILQEELETVLKKWYLNPKNNPNSLVVIASPVEEISQLLHESLTNWHLKPQIPLRLLPWKTRPADFSSSPEQLRSLLTRGEEEKDPEIIIIPNLGWCFLRSVKGLDPVEDIRDLVLKDRSRFWLIGVERVCWQYLDYVCKIGAYFDCVLSLPPLDGEALQECLGPVVEEIEVDFDGKHNSQEEESEKTARDKYFQKLADKSRGIMSVAQQILVRSLRYEVEADSPKKQGIVKTEKPYLPDLPSLSSEEHYLLFSLLLHGELTLSHLAVSLGDEESNVQNLVQVLNRQGLVERERDLIRVNPVHYPLLRDDLDGNNFLIARDG